MSTATLHIFIIFSFVIFLPAFKCRMMLAGNQIFKNLLTNPIPKSDVLEGGLILLNRIKDGFGDVAGVKIYLLQQIQQLHMDFMGFCGFFALL